MSTTRPGQPPNSQPPTRSAPRVGSPRGAAVPPAAAPRREALLVTGLVVVAIIAIIGIALIVSRDGESQAGGPNGTGGDTSGQGQGQGQIPGAPPTATVALSGEPTDTAGSDSEAGTEESSDPEPTPTATTGMVEEPEQTVAPTATTQPQDDGPRPTRGQQDGGGPPLGDVPTDGAQATEADGFISDDAPISVWDTWHPALANLDAALLAAIQQAAADAEAEGIVMVVTSGWRSAAYQQRLLDDAILNYGSEEEARKWVKTPDTSTHVFGTAIDIGYTDADYWLIERGSAYGLCQTYANEIWHFELSIEPGGTCPPPVEDASTP